MDSIKNSQNNMSILVEQHANNTMTYFGYFPQFLVKQHLLETGINNMSTDLKFEIPGSVYAIRANV